MAAAAAETGCDVATIEAHRSLFDRPSLGRVARLLALDRLGFAVGLLLALAIAVGAKAIALGALIATADTAGAIALRVSSGARRPRRAGRGTDRRARRAWRAEGGVSAGRRRDRGV